jgi:hypothetical protein
MKSQLAGYHYSVLEIAANQVRMTVADTHPIRESSVRTIRYLMPLYVFLSFFGCFIVFGFLGGNPKNDQLFGSLHYLSYVIAVLVLTLYGELLMVPLIKQVQQLRRNDSNNVGIDRALKVLRRTQLERKMNGYVNTIVNLLMGTVPFLLRKASYQIPCAWIILSFGVYDIFRHMGGSGGASKGASGTRSSAKISKTGPKQVGEASPTQVGGTVVVSSFAGTVG